jgi:AcrR family transcriptional regulator
MPKSANNVAVLKTSKREANKREKLARIRRAAREVFLREGYDSATMREIAAGADVAFGTLFLYAKDKQDLLLLLFDEELPLLGERAYRKTKPGLPVMDQLIAFFAELYAFFSATPQLSRDMLREITFGGGIVAKRVWASVQETESYVARIVARGQADGSVSPSIAPDLAAHIIFSLHRIEIRFCLSKPEPDVRASLEKLRRQLEVVFTGLAPRNVVPAVETPPPRSRKAAAKTG